MEDNRYLVKTQRVFDTPWVFSNFPKDRNCDLYWTIDKQFNFAHSRCHQCWKVCIEIKTVEQLFQFHELQKTLPYYGKCGIEKRPYVNKLYGGYFYCNSKDEGLYVKGIVKDLINEKIGDLKVSLKRGCTEFEGKYGDSAGWVITKEQEELEREINEKIVYEREDQKPSEDVERHSKREWIVFACNNGDETYKKFNNGEVLLPYRKQFTPSIRCREYNQGEE